MVGFRLVLHSFLDKGVLYLADGLLIEHMGGKIMVTKIKNGWQIFTIFFGLGFIIAMIDIITSQDGPSYYEWFVFITSGPVILIGSIFIVPTKKIFYSDEKLSGYWKIGIGSLKIYESNNYQIYWRNVKNIGSILPLWLPIKVIGIAATRNGRTTLHITGYGYTHTKESLIYIADHVRPEVIDEDVQRLIKKYREKLAKKSRD